LDSLKNIYINNFFKFPAPYGGKILPGTSKTLKNLGGKINANSKKTLGLTISIKKGIFKTFSKKNGKALVGKLLAFHVKK